MIESFVDLTYRGLALGRRIKLTQVRPTTGYLEMPAPMPVGTAIGLATDEGVHIDAVVSEIREQVAGSETVPGMKIVPALDAAPVASWWQARVALPSEGSAPPEAEAVPAEVERSKPVTVRPRSHTVPSDPPAEAIQTPVGADVAAALKMVVEAAATTPVEPPQQLASDDMKRTTIMPAVDQELLEQLTRDTNIELFTHAVVDDGKRTVVMGAVDPAALGLDADASESGAMAAATDDGDGDKPKSPRKRRGKKSPR